MEQIRTYSPPPFDAKVTSTRYSRYVEETGTDDAWELDALEPTVLRDLVRNNVNRFFDRSIADENNSRAVRLREELRDRMMEPGWLQEAMGL